MRNSSLVWLGTTNVDAMRIFFTVMRKKLHPFLWIQGVEHTWSERFDWIDWNSGNFQYFNMTGDFLIPQKTHQKLSSNNVDGFLTFSVVFCSANESFFLTNLVHFRGKLSIDYSLFIKHDSMLWSNCNFAQLNVSKKFILDSHLTVFSFNFHLSIAKSSIFWSIIRASFL